VRQQTEYGTLRTYIRFGAANQTPADSGGGTTFVPFWDRAFMQFAGFTVGRSQSFFDLFTYGGAYSYHNVRVSGDTGASGQNLWGYTAQFGNGFSGTLSLEDPINHRAQAGTIDVTTPNFFNFGAAFVADSAFDNQAAGVFGFRVPDIVANLRVDQAWGFAGVSAVLHNASGAYYNFPNNVNNGHPEDKYGWALAGGAKFNLAGGDMIGFNVCYAEGDGGRCTNENGWQLYNNSNSVGLSWNSDGIFGTGTQIELTRTWSALAAYEHIWNPKWRTAVGGGYVDVKYNAAATNLILSQTAGAATACGVPAAGAPTLTVITLQRGNSCSPSYSYWEAYTRTQWNPVAQLDIGMEVMYTHHNTAFKGPATLAANGSRPLVVNGIVDDQNVWSAMFRWQRNFYP
jgi:Porin subfamily